MTETVKAKVAEHHFKKHVSIGDKTLTKEEETEVERGLTLRNMVRAGNVIVTEGDLTPDKDEKSFQEDDGSGEESEEDVEVKELDEMTKDELKELAEQKDVKKSGTKDELIERLKNER